MRLLGGMASGNGSVIQGYIADVTPPDERTGQMSWLGAAYNIGFIVGPALGGLLANPSAGHAGFRIPLLVASGLSALCVIGLIAFLKESRVRITASATGRAAGPSIAYAATNPVIGRLMLVTLLAGCAFNGIESVFGLWTQARFNWRPAGCRPRLRGHRHRRGVLPDLHRRPGVKTLRRSARAGIRHAAHDGLRHRCSRSRSVRRMVVAILSISAFGQSIAWPNVSALLSRNVDLDHQGQYLGLNNAVGALARLVGPQIAALTFSNIGVDAPFFSAGLHGSAGDFLRLVCRDAQKSHGVVD